MDLSGDLARTLLELAPDPTVIADAKGTIIFVNAQVERTFGYASHELLGAAVETLLPERFRDAHPKHRQQFAGQPKSRPMGAGLSLYARHKDGHEFPVEISLSPVATAEGPLVVAAVRDATLNKDKEAQLIAANRQKSHFLASASHDLRQPLQTLNLLNRAARRQAGGHAALSMVLERQQIALDSMSALLASVLDISKLDSGAVIAAPKPSPLDDVFNRLRSDFEPQAADKGLALIIEPTPEFALIDPELLRRLLGNLISNAIRYTRSGEVRVACRPRGVELLIEVVDTGIGIPSDQLERVFEEFYQVDRDAQRPEGLGLGLSIVRRLAQLLDCKIDVESALGKGTVFRATIRRAELVPEAETHTSADARALGGRVLIVDDERAVAEATSLLLELEGFEVSIASSEQEALERVRTRVPDVIVSDYHLRGGETGVRVVDAVRHRLRRAVPVIFVTGDTAKPAIADSQMENARLMNKPVRADDLVEAVRSGIGMHQAARHAPS
jgi:PAS domain S-box-containing protein